MIYFDNAATTLHKPHQVIDAVVDAMNSMGNSARGTSSGALKASRTVYEARVKIAELLGCPKADHVIFTCNSTEALNIAINGTIEPKDHIISTDFEHNSVLRPLYRLQEEQDVALSFVSANSHGNVLYDDFETLIRPETKAIVCNHASNLTGNMLDVASIGRIAHRHGLLFIVDASQTAGCVPVNMAEIDADILCFTGHKGLMGPQGTGGLCVREGTQIRPLKVGGSGVQSYSKFQPKEYPTRLEAGTMNNHGIAGLSAAVDYIQEIGIDVIAAKEAALMNRFYEGVKQIEGVEVYGDFSASERTAIVALNIRDYDSGSVSDELSRIYDIATRPGAHCAPRMHQALGTQDRGAVRFSFSWFNTEAEIDEVIRAVREISL
ncbi:MAG: aminotransferase class V-fold PLP-dependent enzyme [Clostridia bacterium]|nr:aminotransferase class V-fold PLP-dependent enzyme [Clostridia bacterium]